MGRVMPSQQQYNHTSGKVTPAVQYRQHYYHTSGTVTPAVPYRHLILDGPRDAFAALLEDADEGAIAQQEQADLSPWVVHMGGTNKAA